MAEAAPTAPATPQLPATARPAVAAGTTPPGAQPGELDPPKLTPEEQMALFEKDLKENDWGHQPC